MQLSDLVVCIEGMTDEALRSRLEASRYRQSVERPSAKAHKAKAVKKVAKKKLAKVEKVLDVLSDDDLEKLFVGKR